MNAWHRSHEKLIQMQVKDKSVKKINSLWNQFWKEFKRINESKTSGKGVDETYTQVCCIMKMCYFWQSRNFEETVSVIWYKSKDINHGEVSKNSKKILP